jgi:hypothetical protein
MDSVYLGRVFVAKLGVVLAACFALLAFAATALADRAVVEGYGSSQGGAIQNDVAAGSGGSVEGVVSQGGTDPAVASSNLPFTGLDLVLIVGGGLALVALGLMLRRFARGHQT